MYKPRSAVALLPKVDYHRLGDVVENALYIRATSNLPKVIGQYDTG